MTNKSKAKQENMDEALRRCQVVMDECDINLKKIETEIECLVVGAPSCKRLITNKQSSIIWIKNALEDQ